MAGKTLIDTELRNEVLDFLDTTALLNIMFGDANISGAAASLHKRMSPKWIKKTKTEVEGWGGNLDLLQVSS
jgi:hypothetical protein